METTTETTMMEARECASQLLIREGSPTSVIAFSVARLSCESSGSSQQGSLFQCCSNAMAMREGRQSASVNGSSSAGSMCLIPSFTALNAELPFDDQDLGRNLPGGIRESREDHKGGIDLDKVQLTFDQRSDCQASSPNSMFSEWRSKRAEIESSPHADCHVDHQSRGGGRRKETQGKRNGGAMPGNACLAMAGEPHERAGGGGVGKTKPWRVAAPGSPAYTVGETTIKRRAAARAAPPSKWDDAEKWLINSSTEPSPAHPHSRTTIPRPSADPEKKSSSLALKLRRLAAGPGNMTTTEHHPMAAPPSPCRLRHSHPPPHNPSNCIPTENQKLQMMTMDRRKTDRQTNKSAAAPAPRSAGKASIAEPATLPETDLPVGCQKISSISSSSPSSTELMNFPRSDISSNATIADHYSRIIKTTLCEGARSPKRRSTSSQTDNVDPFTQELGQARAKIKQISTFDISSIIRMRDVSTQITPFSSSHPSRSTTPLKDSPARPNTPTSTQLLTPPSSAPLDLQKCPHEDLENSTDASPLEKSPSNAWSSKEDKDAESYKTLCPASMAEGGKMNILEGRARPWEKAQKAKYLARYKQEETKIHAWESHQITKIEAELLKVEVKLERMKSHAHEKLMNKLANAQHRAKGMLSIAQSRQYEQINRIEEHGQYMRTRGWMYRCLNISKSLIDWS